MSFKGYGSRGPGRRKIDRERMGKAIAEARKEKLNRDQSYREQSLRIHPWICARCGREFTSRNLHLLTVHHKDQNHENNPPDGSNWENLCIYCHDNEHRRYLDHLEEGNGETEEPSGPGLVHKPLAGLEELLNKK